MPRNTENITMGRSGMSKKPYFQAYFRKTIKKTYIKRFPAYGETDKILNET